ncbi:hypothetical protein ASE61_04935 [Bosea sp. Root670]|nr:hypothetical protein ASE61_04935 [Bosea sp. Root670]
MNHGEEVFGQLVVAGRNPPEVLQFGEEALDQVALAVEPRAEVRFGPPIGLWRDIGERAPFANGYSETIGIVGLVGQYDCSGGNVIEQIVGSLNVMTLPSGKAQPDGEALPVDNRVDFGRDPASGATETMISIPLFTVAACWWARTEVLSIIWMSPSWAAVMASIIRSQTPAFRHRTKRL